MQDRVPRTFRRVAAKMYDALDTGNDFLDLRQIGEVGGHEFLVRDQIVRLADVAPTGARVDALEQLAQARADAACGSGDENFFHRSLLMITTAVPLRRTACSCRRVVRWLRLHLNCG